MNTAKQIYMRKRIRFTVLSLLLAAATVGGVYSQQAFTPKGPYLMIKDGNEGILLAWTSASTVPVTVEYGTTVAYGSEILSEPEIIFLEGSNREFMHICDFEDLSSGTKYFYKVVVGGNTFEGSFVTPDPEASSLKFVIFSDPQDGEGTEENGKNLAANYINELYDTDPGFQTFAVCAGDVANSREDYFRVFFSGESADPDIGTRVMLRNLFFATAKGNHDFYAGDPEHNPHDDYFNALFPYAAGRQYYSYDYGPAHISVLDAYNGLTSGSDQINWLENDLANTNKPWKFIIVHEPAYPPWSDDSYRYNDYIRSVVQPLCKKYNVAMVISGHLHVYSRAEVPSVNGPTVRHIITSSLGPTQRDPESPNEEFIVHTEGSLRNIIKINIIDDHTLEYAPVYTWGDSYGQEFDLVTINRPYDVKVTSNTGSTATISWKSDVPGNSTVLYGTTRDLVNSNPLIASTGGSNSVHSVTLSNLTEETQYWFRVMTNGECSDYISFIASTVELTTEPETQASDLVISNVGSSSITINWTPGNNGVEGDARSLVVIRAGSAVQTPPADKSVYDADAVFGRGDAVAQGHYVVYNGSESSVTVTGLPSSTECHVAVYAYNMTVDYSQNYLTDNPATGFATTRIAPPVALAATAREATSFTANWDPVVGAEGYQLDIAEDVNFNDFVDGYTSLDVEDVTSRVVTGLDPAASYYYRLRTYVGNDNISDNSNTIAILPLSAVPEVQASDIQFSNVMAQTINISWTKGDGEYSLVLIKQGSAVDADPANGMTYVANPEFKRGSQIGSDNYVVYKGGEASINVTGLVPGGLYHVAIYSFNGENSSEHYLIDPSPARNSMNTFSLPPQYFSVKSGLWRSADTWLCSLDDDATRFTPEHAPTIDDGASAIHLVDEHVITIDSDLTVNDIEVGGYVQLIIEPGVTLTFPAGTYGIYCAGTVTNKGTIEGDGTITFARNSQYEHAAAGASLPFDNVNWNDGSKIILSSTGKSIPEWNYPSGVTLEISTRSKTIEANESLTVGGNLITDNLLTIASTGSSSGSLIVRGTSTGNITYQRSIPDDGETQKWHYISAPVTPVELNSDKSIYSWDEAAGDWSVLQNIDEEIESGKGYTLIGGGSVSFIGTMVQSDQTIVASSPFAEPFDGTDYDMRDYVTGRSYSSGYGGGGWNLLGNPYTSALSVSAFIDANYSTDHSESSFDPNYVALYLFDGDDYQYVTVNDGGWGEPQAHGTLLNATHIQAGQGFFVLAMNDRAEFNFTRSMQEHSPAATLLKSAGNRSRWPGLALKVSDGTAERQTVVMLNETMTTGLDPMYDVGKMGLASGIDIYTALVEDNGVNFARQALSPYGYENPVIPVGLECSEGGIINFSADVEPLRGFHYWLEDRETGVMTDLSSGGGYSVSVPQGTTGTGRFFMHISVWRPERQGVARSRDFPGIRVWAAGDQQVVIKGEVSEQTHCEVHTISGQKIYEKRLAGGDYNTITLPGTAKGVYLITVIDGEQRVTQRVTLL